MEREGLLIGAVFGWCGCGEWRDLSVCCPSCGEFELPQPIDPEEERPWEILLSADLPERV